MTEGTEFLLLSRLFLSRCHVQRSRSSSQHLIKTSNFLLIPSQPAFRLVKVKVKVKDVQMDSILVVRLRVETDR